MRRRTTVREYVPVGRVSWLVIALAGTLAAWLLFHYQAPGIMIFVVAASAVLTGLLGFLMLPPGPAYSFASRQRDGRGARESRAPFDAPVGRLRIALYSALLGLLAGLAHWLGAPPEVVGVLALCTVLQAAVILLPDRVRKLFAWDINLW